MGLLIDIEKRYKDFSLKVKFNTEGKPTGLLGASGCGKSLTLRCIAGIEKPDRGQIILNDRVLYASDKGINLSPQKRNIGYLFQNYALFPNMTVRQNIELAVRNKNKSKTTADKLMEMLRLTGLQKRYPDQLSGGEQQRTALARMMAYEPELMMFDEPFSALDSFLKDQLQQELSEVLNEYKGDLLMVSHNRDELYRFCQKIAVLKLGRMIELGEKNDIYSNPSNIHTAKLTGCKNISRARRISEYEVKALDWKLILRTDRPVEEEVCYVGIRAHNIRPDYQFKGINSMRVSSVGFSEGPFEYSFIFCPNESENEEGKLYWIVTKQEWREVLKENLPEFISLPKEHLLLLKDNF